MITGWGKTMCNHESYSRWPDLGPYVVQCNKCSAQGVLVPLWPDKFLVNIATPQVVPVERCDFYHTQGKGLPDIQCRLDLGHKGGHVYE